MNNLQITLSSQEVAKMVGKRHADLLRDIETYSKYLLNDIERKIALNDFFIQSTYKDSIGRKLKCYNITKKGCELIAHKMTGQKGVLFTAEYINRFHKMKEELSNQKPEYQFQPKTHKGQPCVTLADLAHLSGITQPTIRYHIKRVLNHGSDYVVLHGNELINFKAENTAINLRLVLGLTIVFKSGFVKLARIIHGLPKQLEYFKDDLQHIPKANKKLYSLDLSSIKDEIDTLQNSIGGISKLLQVTCQYQKEISDFSSLFYSIKTLAFEIYDKATDLPKKACFTESN